MSENDAHFMISNAGQRSQKASAITDPVQAIKDFYM